MVASLYQKEFDWQENPVEDSYMHKKKKKNKTIVLIVHE